MHKGDVFGFYRLKSDPYLVKTGKGKTYRKVDVVCLSCGTECSVYVCNLQKQQYGCKICSCKERRKFKKGDKKGGLTFLKYLEGSSRKILCCCDSCGNQVKILLSHFGRNKSCGCRKLRRGKQNPVFTGYEEIYGYHFSNIKKQAKDRGLRFDITIEGIWDLYITQERKCAITGLSIEFEKSAKNRSWTASLDRIDNSKGYVADNVHWVHTKVNRMKMDLPMSEFAELCHLVVEHNTISS